MEANDEVATAAAAAEVAAEVAETATEAAASVTSVVVEGRFGPVTRAAKPADSPTTSVPDRRRRQHEVAAEAVEEAVEAAAAAAAVVDDRPAVVAGSDSFHRAPAENRLKTVKHVYRLFFITKCTYVFIRTRNALYRHT